MNVRIIARLMVPEWAPNRYRFFFHEAMAKKYEFIKEFDLELTLECLRDMIRKEFVIEPGYVFDDALDCVPPREAEVPGVMTICVSSYMREDTPEHQEELARHGWVLTKTR